jgi:hypothetical protein
MGAGGHANRASVHLANEERSSGRQRGFDAKEILGVDKGEKQDGEEEDIESLGIHCVM